MLPNHATHHIWIKEVKRLFTPALIIWFRNTSKLNSYLVRAKLYRLERIIDLFQVKRKRCQTCYNVKQIEKFTSTSTGENFKINHKLSCNDQYLVYLFTCKVYLKQYVGQTAKEFRCRRNNYKNTGRNYQEFGTCMQQHLCMSIFLKRNTTAFGKISLLHRLNSC